MILTSLWLVIAAGGTAVTITKSKFFLGLREWAWCFWGWLGEMLYCPYCTAHWLALAGVAVYRPRLIGTGPHIVDVFVTALVIIAGAVFVAGLLCRLYSNMFSEPSFPPCR